MREALGVRTVLLGGCLWGPSVFLGLGVFGPELFHDVVVYFVDAFRCQSFDRFGVLSFLHQLQHLMVDGGSDGGVILIGAWATLVRTIGHASHRFLAKVDPITFGCPEEEVSHPIRGVEGEVFPPPPPRREAQKDFGQGKEQEPSLLRFHMRGKFLPGPSKDVQPCISDILGQVPDGGDLTGGDPFP